MAIILTTRYITPLWGASKLGVPTPMEQRIPSLLRERQRLHLLRNPATSEPWSVTEPTTAYIGCGVWRIECACHEAPHTDPEWKLACCFGCGAIYENVVFPERWRDIEKLLSMRRLQQHRNWIQPETFEELIAEQRAFGDPLPEGTP